MKYLCFLANDNSQCITKLIRVFSVFVQTRAWKHGRRNRCDV